MYRHPFANPVHNYNYPTDDDNDGEYKPSLPDKCLYPYQSFMPMGSRSSFFQSKSPQRDHVPGTQEFDVSTNTDQISQRVDPRQIDRNFIEGERLGQINIRPVVRAWRRAFKRMRHRLTKSLRKVRIALQSRRRV
ncbi:hypothetical protein PNOK_0663500 [Pyrrhoderma noxium]|uniref:Uncharacterized protein n=1 Tax=Pyrrhoderma noxium TaxID=2282107 RepID=A0A286UF53_9AGAM|nr:hypothetical protein PNOK_0663500 [Pyrrhoderma noxium]